MPTVHFLAAFAKTPAAVAGCESQSKKNSQRSLQPGYAFLNP
jgi:hypothetical protein